MSNETKQTALDSLLPNILELTLQLSNKRISQRNCELKILELFEQAKEMEKEQMIEFAQEVFRNRYNQITQSLGNIADDIYNETYGGNK